MNADDQMDGPSVKRGGILLGVLLWVAVALSMQGGEARAQDSPRRVLILHAYNYTFPATTLVSDAARKRLLQLNSQRLEIEADFLDLARLPGEVHAQRMATFLREKYEGKRFDLVLAIGVAAVPFLIKYREQFAPGVPVVFAGGTREHLASFALPGGVTGVVSGFEPDKILDLAERLQPKARRVMVIGGASELDRSWQKLTRQAIESREPKFETTYRFDFAYDALLSEISHLPNDTIVILLTVYGDKNGRRFIPQEVAGAVATAASAPVYGPFETFIGTGVVGGYTETYQSLGIAAGDMAHEILSGKDPATIPLRVNPGQAFRVDARAMERWGLKRSNLPPGSTVLFSQPSVWEQHYYLISAAILVLALQSAVVAALLFQRHRRRKAENLLRESEDRMSFTAASVNAGLWQFDRTTDELWAMEHCRAIFGLPKDSPLTREAFVAAVHPDDRRVAVGTLRGVTKGQAAITDVRIIKPDGEVRWIRVRARSHLDERGMPDQLSGLFVDITEQKASESEVELQRQEVSHLMRASVLGELSGAIAHEVNQPLTAILSNAQAALYLLDRKSPDLAEVRDALRDIVLEDNRAGEIIHRLRGLLKKGQSRSESVDLNKLVASTMTLLRSELIDRRVTAETELAADLPTVFGDSVQLQQVLLNLVVNAMDAMASTPVEQRRMNISTRETPAGAIEILVKDQGPGIAPVDGKQVFEPFYTTKEHGLGLGLTICSTIVHKHGGTIALRNDAAGGTVAEVLLPAPAMLMAAQ